ncbi:MAG: Ig-like domain-containing protein [Clostridia bacterium]|nr:Ig-like domain-containing protein [Clostridia bacterium]
MGKRNDFAIRKVCGAVSALLVLALVLVIMPGIARADNVTVTFDANGGTPATQTIMTTTNESGKEVLGDAFPSASRDNCTFDGWFTSEGSKVTENTEFTSNTTVYAHWIGNVDGLTLDKNPPSWSTTIKGDTTSLTATATVTPDDAEAPAITWTTSDATVVSLSATSGKTVTLTAEGNGQATVTATSAGQTATCDVRVSIPPAAAVTMKGTASGTVNTPLTGSFTLTLTDATFNAVSAGDVTSWFTNIPSGLTATAEATAAGSTTLKVTISGTPTVAGTNIQAACTVPASANSSGSAVTLKPSSDAVYNIESAPSPTPVPLTSFKLDPAKKTLYDSQSVQLKMTDIKPKDATIKSVTYASSNTSVATVDSNGLVTAKGYGTATITAIATDENGNNVSATSKITVMPKIYLSFKPNNSKLGKNDSTEMTIEITNPSEEYAWVKRSNKRIYYSGYTKKVTASNGTVWYKCKLKDGKATLTIKPQYNGKATVTVAHEDAASVSADFTVSGYHNLPATGQNSMLIYILSGVGVLAAAGLAAAYTVKRKKENAD